MTRLLTAIGIGLLFAATSAATLIGPARARFAAHTVMVANDGMTMDGRPTTAAEVKRQVGCSKTQAVVLRAATATRYEAFMRAVNDLQAQNCFKIGLIVEDASPQK